MKYFNLFDTKKEALDYFNEIRKSYNIGEIVSDHHKEILIKLINIHPNSLDIVNSGIDFIKVDKDKFNDKCFYSVDFNGVESSFSPKSAMNLKKDYKSEFIEAARAEVVKDILSVRNAHLLNYKKGDMTMSAISGEWFKITDIHIDHSFPRFIDIVSEFMQDFDVKKIKYVKVNGGQNTFKDRTLAINWRRFHSKKANLRIVSSQENLRRSREINEKSIINDLKIIL